MSPGALKVWISLFSRPWSVMPVFSVLCFLCFYALCSTPTGTSEMMQISNVYRSRATWTKNRTQSFFFLSNSKKYIVSVIDEKSERVFCKHKKQHRYWHFKWNYVKRAVPTDGSHRRMELKTQVSASCSCLLLLKHSLQPEMSLKTFRHKYTSSFNFCSCSYKLPKGKDVLWNFNFSLWVLSLTMHFWIKSYHRQLIFWISKICYDRH